MNALTGLQWDITPRYFINNWSKVNEPDVFLFYSEFPQTINGTTSIYLLFLFAKKLLPSTQIFGSFYTNKGSDECSNKQHLMLSSWGNPINNHLILNHFL